MCVCIAGRGHGVEYGEVDILHRPEMSGAPPLPPPLLFTSNPPPVLLSHLFILSGRLFFLPANRCFCCHLLYFMCLEHGSLSAPNASVSVSPLFYLQIPPCHRKKVRRLSVTHLWMPIRARVGAAWVCRSSVSSALACVPTFTCLR